MTIISHPSLIEKKEKELAAREYNFQVRKYFFQDKEKRVLALAQKIKIVSFASFCIGMLTGTILVYLFL
tara:strand:+ start:4537 stop:4743 length:207 start_codon:yes stop_codon:yes gene_type:complete